MADMNYISQKFLDAVNYVAIIGSIAIFFYLPRGHLFLNTSDIINRMCIECYTPIVGELDNYIRPYIALSCLVGLMVNIIIFYRVFIIKVKNKIVTQALAIDGFFKSIHALILSEGIKMLFLYTYTHNSGYENVNILNEGKFLAATLPFFSQMTAYLFALSFFAFIKIITLRV